MFERSAEFNKRPLAIEYVALPDGQADVWLRRNIAEAVHKTEDVEENIFVAEEAYMRDAVSKDEIEQNFDKWFDLAKDWSPNQEGVIADPEKRIEVLERFLAENLFFVE